MSLFSRLSNGWKISMKSFQVLKTNKQLLFFPLLSGASMIILTASFAFAAFFAKTWIRDLMDAEGARKLLAYAGIFGFYLLNYFIVVFFNVALMRCVRMVFNGEEVDMKDGINYSFSRIGTILGWSVIAATVGTILKIIQEETGIVGKIITGIIGLIWNVTTFFVVPVLAYENTGPIEAIGRSAGIIKAKWGESLAGNFSLGLVQFLALLLIAVPLFFVGSVVNTFTGIALAVFAGILIIAIISAAQAIFISAVYQQAQGVEVAILNDEMVDDLFVRK
ncbi:hypothetical protein I5907_11255 [Panacibacter sp. DH6]|uniref:Glycerophosphoryl diester phosphodiesterase membrane domain-containing protein n=1 Tax=Panacibacter microcysteis TaxID=2793269 RepID=A0A931E610_9BACT|nr:DUF6159 family protein [Panacibacter microcysteis]MBG9376817.1 hypothetical protein [Panacibacter microcysteis]